MPPKLSIVTCTWNSEPYLEQSIASVLMQDYPNVEYIFVDGGSDDGTLERIRAINRPFTLIENIRGGISNAMNHGAQAATGDFIAHLHSDDYYANPHVFSTVATALINSQKRWLFGRIATDINGQIIKENFIAPRFSMAAMLKANFVPHPAVFVARDLFHEVGGFDLHLKYAMDYDLWLRLARIAAPVQLDETLAVFREHAGSLSTSNPIAATKEDFQVRLKYAGTNPFLLAWYHLRFQVNMRRFTNLSR